MRLHGQFVSAEIIPFVVGGRGGEWARAARLWSSATRSVRALRHGVS